MTRFLDDHEYELAHVHWLYPDALCIPAIKKKSLPTVLTVHGSDWYQTKDRPDLMKLFEEVLQYTDKVLYSGPQLKTDMEEVFPELSSKSDIIYNMVDEKTYQPASHTLKKSYQEELGWDPAYKHILTVANIREEKGIDLLLDAVEEIGSQKPLHFHVLGAIDESPFARSILERLEKGTFRNVTLHEPVAPAALIPYYQAADMYLLPSRREGFNVSILEALACGLPVICSDVGGNRLVVDEDSGMILEDMRKEALANTIQEFTVQLEDFDPEIIHKKVTERFGRRPYLQRLKKIYQDLS